MITSSSRRYLGILMVSVVVSSLTVLGHEKGFNRRLESAWLNGVVAATSSWRAVSDSVFFVGITDSDYERFFSATTPLPPDSLRRLVNSVASHRPSLLVLDIDIRPKYGESGQAAYARTQLFRSLTRFSATDSYSSLVLIEPARPVERSSGYDGAVLAAWDSLIAATDEVGSRIRWASAKVIAEDGLVQRAPFRDSDGHATILDAAASALAEHNKSAHLASRPILILYTGQFSRLDSMRSAYALPAGPFLTEPEVTRASRTLLTGKIVVIGTAHYDSADWHETPVGRISGGSLWAEALDALLRPPGPPREIHGWWLLLLIEIVIGCCCGVLLDKFGSLRGWIASLVSVLVLTVLSSIVSFVVGAQVFVNFLPCLIGVDLDHRWHLYRASRKTP